MSLIITPIILLFPLTVGAVADPSAMIEHYDLYLLFYGLPFFIAALLLVRARRLDRSPQS